MDQTLLRQNATNVLNQALLAEFGLQVCIHSTGLIHPANRGKQQLYRFKNESLAYSRLYIKLHPDDPENRLWILNGEKVVAQPHKNEPNEAEPYDLDISL